MAAIDKPECALLNVLSSLGQLEWRHFQSRYPEIWKNGHFEKTDCSGYPPYTSFRFEKEDPNIIKILYHAIESYNGKVEWMMYEKKKEYGSGINRVILPKKLHDAKEKANAEGVAVGKYVAENQPNFGPVAYEDLINLAEHVKIVLKKNNIEI